MKKALSGGAVKRHRLERFCPACHTKLVSSQMLVLWAVIRTMAHYQRRTALLWTEPRLTKRRRHGMRSNARSVASAVGSAPNTPPTVCGPMPARPKLAGPFKPHRAPPAPAALPLAPPARWTGGASPPFSSLFFLLSFWVPLAKNRQNSWLARLQVQPLKSG